MVGRGGALASLRVLELGGIGPAPFAGMVLADMGADVVRIDRPGPDTNELGMDRNLLMRGKRSVQLDLTSPEGRAVAWSLIEEANVLIEGFRPMVLERLGFAPELCWERNQRLSVGRMTGWGQSGPMAAVAGHDINYIGLAGVLHSVGPAAAPVVPLNLVGDYGGGGLLLAFGLLCAVFETSVSGRGQVVDAAMVDGSALLMARWFGEMAFGRWHDNRGQNLVDGSAPFYRAYEAADGGFVAVGAIEERFFAQLISVLGIDPGDVGDRWDRTTWSDLSERFALRFKSRSRDEWVEAFDGVDACVTPVLSMREAIDDEHNRSRETFVEIDGITQPAAAPRLGRTPGRAGSLPVPGQHTQEVLEELGLEAGRIEELDSRGVIRRASSAAAGFPELS
ncbi:MAG: carnitine dehydratase [Acidimicrobiaceae bacterium]|nr:carnitine dehydratase [Acidimicrobiaceae bacterium]